MTLISKSLMLSIAKCKVKHRAICFVSFVIFFVSTSSFVTAQVQPRQIGEEGNWRVFEAQTSTGKVCFASTLFTKTSGRGGDLSDNIYKQVSAYISHRPEEQVYAEVSFQAFPGALLDGSHTLTIDGRQFDLITQNNAAFVVNEEMNAAVVEAMKKGIAMKVSVDVERDGTTNVANTVVDEYSLIGLTRAMNLISQACTAP